MILGSHGKEALFPTRLRTQETFLETMFLQQFSSFAGGPPLKYICLSTR